MHAMFLELKCGKKIMKTFTAVGLLAKVYIIFLAHIERNLNLLINEPSVPRTAYQPSKMKKQDYRA